MVSPDNDPTNDPVVKILVSLGRIETQLTKITELDDDLEIAKERITLLEAWKNKTMGILTVVGIVTGSLFSWILTKL